MSDEQLFPVTEEERIAGIRLKLSKDAEKARDTYSAAALKAGDALDAMNEAEAFLVAFDHMTAIVAQGAALGELPRSVLEEAAAMVNAGALGPDVSATVVPAARP